MKNPLISSNISISQSMKKLSETGQRCLVIVDIKKKLLGTLTDGDIRRCLIKEINLETSVKKILNKNPTVVLENDLSVRKNIKLFDKKKLYCPYFRC